MAQLLWRPACRSMRTCIRSIANWPSKFAPCSWRTGTWTLPRPMPAWPNSITATPSLHCLYPRLAPSAAPLAAAPTPASSAASTAHPMSTWCCSTARQKRLPGTQLAAGLHPRVANCQPAPSSACCRPICPPSSSQIGTGLASRPAPLPRGIQGFDNGRQSTISRSYEGRARAVRRFPI